MSSSTWTQDALRSSATALEGRCWRVVEAQHQVSTMKITDTLAEQTLLEDLLEDTKPPVPRDCVHLHFLLMTPFRYSATNPFGSRFRKPFAEHGVFYAAEHPATARAETAFHRSRDDLRIRVEEEQVRSGTFTRASVLSSSEARVRRITPRRRTTSDRDVGASPVTVVDDRARGEPRSAHD